MHHLCGADPPDPGALPGGAKALAARQLWRAPAGCRARRRRMSARRDAARRAAGAPARARTGDRDRPVRLVGIDTGIIGDIDADQGDWLRRVSAGAKPKILLTGKPLYVDGETTTRRRRGQRRHRRRRRARAGAQLRRRDRRRHPQLPALPRRRRRAHDPVRRRGGGGAFMHATHTIPKVDVERRHRGRVPLLPAARRLARVLQPPLQPQGRLRTACSRSRRSRRRR